MNDEIKTTTDTPRTDAMPKRYMTVVYEIVDETEWRKTNPLKYAHNGLSAVTVSAYDAIELLDEAEAEVERLQTLPESRHKAFLDLLERAEKAQAEVKQIRSALGDDGRRTHKELIELATKAAEWRTWKEKYIDLKNAHIAEGQDPAGTIWEHADKLQKQVTASQTEVERFRKEIAYREELDAVAQEVWDEMKAENKKLRELVGQAADWLDYMGRSQSSATLREALNP
jgi:vacuolar-type H+-ATPase subunit I/STV1